MTKTKVMYRASLSYAQLKKYENFLEGNKLIEISADDLWVLTEKGKQYLDAYRLVDQIIKRQSDSTTTTIYTGTYNNVEASAAPNTLVKGQKRENLLESKEVTMYGHKSY